MSVFPTDLNIYGSLCMPAYDGAATLNGSIGTTSVATAAINLPTSAFPAQGEYAIQVDSEIMWVTQGAQGSAAGTVTVIRGACGTTAATHSNAAAVTMPIGGGVDFTTKMNFTDIVAGHTLDVVGFSASDTKVKIITTGRDSTGTLKQETLTMNGQTPVTGSQVWDRIDQCALAAVTTCTNNPLTNAGTSLTVTTSGALPASGNYYVKMGLEIMQVTAGQGTGTLTVTRGVLGTTATAHQNLDNIYLLPLGDVAVYDHTKIITNHTMQAGGAQSTGTTPAVTKLAAADGASTTQEMIIRTLAGTGPNQLRSVKSVGVYISASADAVSVNRDWSTLVDNTTTYDIYNGCLLELSPNQICNVQRYAWNQASQAAGGSTNTFYEIVYAANNNTATAFTAATIQDAANSGALPGTSTLDLAVATAANATTSAVNRQTSPGSFGSFSVQPLVTSFTANSGTLASGAAPNQAGAQGIVLRWTVPAGTAPYKGSADMRFGGNTI